MKGREGITLWINLYNETFPMSGRNKSAILFKRLLSQAAQISQSTERLKMVKRIHMIELLNKGFTEYLAEIYLRLATANWEEFQICRILSTPIKFDDSFS